MDVISKQLILSGKFVKYNWSNGSIKFCTSNEDSDSIEINKDDISDDKWYTIEFIWRGQLNVNEVVFIDNSVEYENWS